MLIRAGNDVRQEGEFRKGRTYANERTAFTQNVATRSGLVGRFGAGLC